MSFESYKKIVSDYETCIKPGNSVSYSFSGEGNEKATRLFITGETNISYYWKTEPDYEMLYRRIDDSLRSDISRRDRFCLDFSDKPREYTKIAFKKLVSPFSTPMFTVNNCTDNWSFGVSAMAKDLKIDGFLRVTIEVRYKKEGVGKHSTVPLPDEIYTLDIPEGSYDWQAFKKDIVIDYASVANVCYYLEGKKYGGEIYFEEPHFTSESGFNLVGQFLPHTEDSRGVNWIGQNLSRIEWVGFKVDINGKNLFDGEIFERCHRFSEWEFEIPEGIICSGENTITFTCTSDYRDAAGYILGEFGFITEKPSAIISYPEVVTLGKPFFVCIEGKKGDLVSFKSDIIEPADDLTLKYDGLNSLAFICSAPMSDVHMILAGEDIVIRRVVEREDDGVITGSGDMLYMVVDEPHVTNFLKWYLSQNIGNLLTIRPSYRWNATRVYNSGLYRKIARFLNSMGIQYSHMLDGRELPGANANPTVDDIDTESFLGRQTHEFDGQFVYWKTVDLTNDLSKQMFFDLFVRIYRQYPDRMNEQYAAENLQYTDEKQYYYRTPKPITDMQAAAEQFISRLQDTRKGYTRHTGPATLFKYFYQAGYTWLGAELMYTPTELTIASLRGANLVYGGKIGAHHAVQWSTSPHDTEYRYRRYRLALFISYIQGIDEINTEEGLWHLEEFYHYHHRFSPACVNHAKAQQDLYRYILSHTRRGRFYTPIAFLSGRYDGWRCFGRGGHTWGIDDFTFSDIERSWDLLTYFYPKSILNCLFGHNRRVEEIGYYTGTPIGNVDILPIEAKDYSNYRLLVAPGFNKAIKEDIEKLKNYVTNGGTLLLGWTQLSETTDRESAVRCEHTYYGDMKPTFVDDTYCSLPVSVSSDIEYDEVLVYTDSNKPLVTVKNIGRGKLCFVNAKEYAGTAAVDRAYRAALDVLTPEVLGVESIYARGDRNVQFTVFEKKDGGRDIYFIATDWHKDIPDGTAKLVLGSNEYTVNVPWGKTVKVAAYGDAAIYPENDEFEVVSFDGKAARVQGVGKADFIVCKNGKSNRITVDFDDKAVKDIVV